MFYGVNNFLVSAEASSFETIETKEDASQTLLLTAVTLTTVVLAYLCCFKARASTQSLNTLFNRIHLSVSDKIQRARDTFVVWSKLAKCAGLEAPSRYAYISLITQEGNFSRWVQENQGRLHQFECLDLSDNNLRTLPAELGQLSNLTYLNLINNKLREIPAELGQLNKLVKIEIGNNDLSTLPAEIGQLQNLRYLNIYNNKLRELPREIGQLSRLQILMLDRNELSLIPAELGQLQWLTDLGLSNNQLNEIPEELGNLGRLWKLDLSNNQLRELPASLGNLGIPESVRVRVNTYASPLRELDRRGQLSSLEYLLLDGNNELSELPAEFWRFGNLKYLGLSETNVRQLPEGLERFRGSLLREE